MAQYTASDYQGQPYYDPTLAIWPDLAKGRVALAPVRVGMDRKTGKILIGWPHVQQSMTTIFSTRYHERVLRRWVGSFVPMMLGESAVARVITRFFWAIACSLDLWEPNYRLKQIFILTDDGQQDVMQGDLAATAQRLRTGAIVFRTEGVYRPRAHLGDTTPEGGRGIGFVGRGNNTWDAM